MPGFAFRGSYLPNDLRTLTYKATIHDLKLPILTSILPNNQLQVARRLEQITAKEHNRIGIASISFKAGTDDRSESSIIELSE
jgi:UDP-glucose 6-dehydrogenase